MPIKSKVLGLKSKVEGPAKAGTPYSKAVAL
jgi:hypothetical protein